MTQPNQVQQHPSSVEAYIRHGWSLVPIPPGTKGPNTRGWNLKQNALTLHSQLPQGYGIGLAHAYSGTMALDIDSWDKATQMLLEKGVDLAALYEAPDAVVIDSGNPGHGKMLFSMPFGMSMPSKKIEVDGVTIYELRCSTSNNLTVQDVLPPSIHPDTKQPYRWAGRGHWTRLPEIPMALLDLWQSLMTLPTIDIKPLSVDGFVVSWDEIREAISHISADCTRDQWVQCGMALQWAGAQSGEQEQALQIWDEWSKGSTSKYPGERGILSQWVSFKNDKTLTVKLGTLFHLAKEAGWERPLPDVSAMFANVTPSAPAVITADLRVPPPNLDITLFPKVLATRAAEVAAGVGCDPLVPLFAGLGAVCGAIDARTRLELMNGFRVPPLLWIMTIGDPGDKKSPGSRPMFSILSEIEKEDRPRFAKEMMMFEVDEVRYTASRKAMLEQQSSPEALLSDLPPLPVTKEPQMPSPLRITVNDITSQKLVRHCADRPRGLLCYLDEMNSWVDKITDSRSGENRSAWTVAYESERYEMDRVGSGTIIAENYALSVFGNIQPKVFQTNLEALSKDGLIQRFIPVPLRSDMTKLGNPVPDYMTNKVEYEQMIRVVFGLPAMVYRLSPAAHATYREFQTWYEDNKRDERLIRSGVTFMTAHGKLEGLVGRLALVWHAIENPYSMEVSQDIMGRAVRFVRDYVIHSLRYVHEDELGGGNSFEQWLADWVIYHADKEVVTMAEIKNGARKQLASESNWQKNNVVVTAMMTLENAKWVARMDDGSQEQRGMATWAINPAIKDLFKDHRRKVAEARQRLLDHVMKDAKTKRYAKEVE